MSTEYTSPCTKKCESCNNPKCQGCVSCLKCNTKCQVKCDSAQKLIGNCSTLKEVTKTTFAFSVRPTANTTQMGPNEGQFNKSIWDEIITYYNKGAKIGKLVSFLSAIDESTNTDVAPFKKDEYDRIAKAVGATRRVSVGEKIYGSYFVELETAVNAKTGNSNACDRCNTGCDCDTGGDTSHCNACQKCNTQCDSCNSQCDDDNSYCCDAPPPSPTPTTS